MSPLRMLDAARDLAAVSAARTHARGDRRWALVPPTAHPTARRDVARLFANLSPDSRYLRFLSAATVVREDVVEAIVDADGTDSFARLAILGDGTCVGEASARRLAPDSDVAEIGVTVAEGHRGVGIGRALIRAVAEDARRAGITRFAFHVAPANGASRAVARAIGASVRFDGDLLAGEVRIADGLGMAR